MRRSWLSNFKHWHVHTDFLYWTKSESEVSIVRIYITSLKVITGVLDASFDDCTRDVEETNCNSLAWTLNWKNKDQTVDSKISSMVGNPSFIWREACIEPSVLRFKSINGQHADFMGGSRDKYSVVGGQIISKIITILIEFPANEYREVAFANCACCSGRLIKIKFVFTEREWNYGWQN